MTHHGYDKRVVQKDYSFIIARKSDLIQETPSVLIQLLFVFRMEIFVHFYTV